MMENFVRNMNVSEVEGVEMFKGIYRRTLTYNDQLQLCHFTMEKNSHIPLHSHKAAQIGYVIKGKVKFFKKDESFIIAGPGDSYVFDSDEFHGSDVLEDTELIECFTPVRPEYMIK